MRSLRTRSIPFLFFFLVPVVFFFAAAVHAQTNEEALKHSRAGYSYEQQNKFREALYEYDLAIKADAKYPYPVERIAAMYQTLRNYKTAVEYFHRAIKLDSNYDVYNYYNLGLSFRLLERYDSAADAFKEFIRRLNPVTAADTVASKDADFWVKFNLGSLAERAKPKHGPEPTALSMLNSQYDDFGPTMTADGQTLYFTSRRKSTNTSKIIEDNDYGEDLFVTHRDTSGKWKTPTAMPAPINSTDDEGTAAISADGQTIYYSLCRRPDAIGECDLYISELNGDNWTPPQNMGFNINTNYWEAEPSISADGSTLYFSSTRPGSIDGSEDLWVSYRNTDGSWTKPANLGEPVNTRFSERSPFISADGKTLYFSSNGHPGYGNHDLFITHKLEDGTWAVPINLGSPINGSGDDEFLTIPAKGNSIIYSTQRNDSRSDLNLFESPLPTEFRPGPVTVVAGMVFDKVTSKPLSAKITVTDLKSDDIVAVYRSNKLTGKFYITLGTGKTYGITATAPNYTFFSENYTVPDTISFKELTHDLPLVPVQIASNEKPNQNPSNQNPSNGKPSNEKPSKGNTTDTNTKGHPTKNPSGNTKSDSTTKNIETATIPLNNLFFDFNKATLRPESITELKNLLHFMKDNPKVRIEIAGHTDSIGSAEVNRKLSQDRAEAVRKYLVDNGIVDKRVVAKGYGSSKPVDTNATEEGRQRNRRTEFRILR